MSELEAVSVILVGFGAVNRALARLIAQETERLAQEHRCCVRYHAVIARHGCWEATQSPLLPSSVSAMADEVAQGSARLDGIKTPAPDGVVATATPSVEAIRGIISRIPTGGPACVIEAIDVDYDAGEPAVTYLQDAISRGCHAISANKGPVVHQRAALLALAAAHGVRYLHESAVMDGVPIFSAWRGGFLPGGARLTKFRGCLNSTTSVVLTGMEKGQTMQEALKTAQDAGIAEADPSGDLKGMDAAVKVVAIASALELGGGAGNESMSLADVAISGIDQVTQEQVAEALSQGRKLRLVSGAECQDGTSRPFGYVRVESLAADDVLYGLDGGDAAVTLYTDRLAPVTITQKGSEVTDTAFGCYADLLRAVRPQAV